MKRFINWLKSSIAPRKASGKPAASPGGKQRSPASGHTVAKPATPRPALPERQPEFVELEPHVEGRIEDRGPGKNVLIRNRYLREDSGTHETLKILDDSMVDSDEDAGFDPYNTGQFDRSKNWDKRSK